MRITPIKSIACFGVNILDAQMPICDNAFLPKGGRVSPTIGAIVLVLEALLFAVLMEPETSKRRLVMRALRWAIQWRYFRRDFDKNYLRPMRPLFRNQHSLAIALWLWGGGVTVAIGIASFSPPIPKDFLYFGYFLFIAATIYSIGWFLSSSFLVNKKVETKGKRGYWYWKWVIPTLIAVFGLYWVFRLHDIQIGRELYELKGVLIPANDSDPPSPCDSTSNSNTKLYIGGLTALAESKEASVIKVMPTPTGNDPVLLGIERAEDGSVALHAHIVGSDQRVIALIDRNHFEINRNRILDSLSPPRTDRSTIVLTDEYGNTLKVHLMNKHSVSFSGKLYFREGEYVQIDQNGISIPSRNEHIGGAICFHLPEGSGILVVSR
jgi:hypothetical protein